MSVQIMGLYRRRGRPRKPPGTKQTIAFPVYLTPAELSMIQAVPNKSAVARAALLAAAQAAKQAKGIT